MNRTVHLFFTFIISGIVVTGCKQHSKKVQVTNKDISQVLSQMTELMVHDVTNPPLASRFFSYACLAGYEVVSENNTKFKSMYGVLNNYPSLKRSDTIGNYSYSLAALLAIIETTKKLQPSGSLLEKYETGFIDSLSNAGCDEEVIEQSKKYAIAVSRKILQYAKANNYNKISNYQRYTPLDKEGTWYPTPPAFIAAIEPYFKTVRPFHLIPVLSSSPFLRFLFLKIKDRIFIS